MVWLVVVTALVAGVVLFFGWANRATARNHARFLFEDVEAALAQFVSPDTTYFDDWDLFLSWPIDDPYLEAIRERCRTIVRESRPEYGEEARAKVTEVLAKLRRRA